jgi:hypothetical protein
VPRPPEAETGIASGELVEDDEPWEGLVGFRRIFKRDEQAASWASLEPGAWYVWAGRPIVKCPTCRGAAGLGKHTITPAGLVEPSVVCGYAGCGFHEFITLEGWDPALLEARRDA